MSDNVRNVGPPCFGEEGDDEGLWFVVCRFQQIHDLIYLIMTNCSFKGAAVEQITLNTSETVSSTVQQDRLHPPEPVLTGSVLHGCCVYVYLYCVSGFVLFNGLVVCVGVDGADAARRLFICLLPQLSDSFVPSVQR